MSNLKNLIKSTEVKIDAINVTAKEQEVKIGELISAHETEKDDLKHDFGEKSEHLFSENKRLKKENENLNEEIKKMKIGFKCYKCDFQAYTGNKFIIHSSKEHTSGNISKCEKCDFSCTTEKDLEAHRSSDHVDYTCSKCIFTSKK